MSSDFSFLGLATAFLRHRRLMVLGPVVVAVLAVAYGYASREYVAESRFLPRTGTSDAARLTGLAAQFGLNLGAGETGESPEFYVDLLKSRDLLLAAAQTRYAYLPAGARDSVAGTLVELLHLKGRSPTALERAAIEALRARVVVATDPRAGIVELRVVAPSGELAEHINRRILELVNDFNLRKRQSQAAAERVFTEQRMHEAQLALDSVENDLRVFTERNRIIEDPALKLEASRLQRRIDLRQQVYLTLAQAFEQARVAEVRNTPVITVVDAPERSAEPSVGLKLSAILGLVLGFFLAVALLLLTEYLERERTENPTGYAGFLGRIRELPGVHLLERALARVWR